MPTAATILAAATGSDGGYGKIGTILAAGVTYVRCPVSDLTGRVKWRVKADKTHTVQLYVAEANVLSGTLTLSDATVVDDGDTFVLCGLTFTGEATEGDASAAARKYWLGANNAEAAVNLTALLNHATYGVPGLTFTVAAVAATDVITIAATYATALHFAQGTSAANEIAFANTTLASLEKDGAPGSATAAETTTSGYTIEQYNDGLVPYLGITNNDGADAMTPIISARRFAT
jgi:hypothetical protein